MRVVVLLLVALMLATTACDDPGVDVDPDGEPEIVELRAKQMRGKYEKPAGDPKAKGFVGTDLNLTTGEVCIEYGTDLGEEPTAMHIHEGEAGTSGDPVVTLPVDGGCVDSEPPLLHDIAEDPASYYVNIHTKKYPDGAIRAQLQPE